MSLFYYLLNYSDVNSTRKVINIMIVKDFSDELIALYEDTEETEEITTLAGVDTIERMFTDKGISFEDIQEVSTNYSKYSKDAIIEFWARLIQIATSKHKRKTNPTDSRDWKKKLENAFYKTHLAEKAILEKLKNDIRSLKPEFNGHDHDYFYEGMGEDTADFASNLGLIECKSEWAKKSNPHEADLLLIYQINKDNVTPDGDITGSFYITQPYHKGQEAKHFIEAIKGTAGPNSLDTTTKEKEKSWFETYKEVQSWPENDRDNLKKIITTTHQFTVPVGADFTIPAGKYGLDFDSYKQFEKEIKAKVKDNKTAKALAQAGNKKLQDLEDDYKQAKKATQRAFNKLKELEFNFYINKDPQSNSAPRGSKQAKADLVQAIDAKYEIATQLAAVNASKVTEEYDFMKTYEELNTLN